MTAKKNTYARFVVVNRQEFIATRAAQPGEASGKTDRVVAATAILAPVDADGEQTGGMQISVPYESLETTPKVGTILRLTEEG